jgi:hypothetical protein
MGLATAIGADDGNIDFVIGADDAAGGRGRGPGFRGERMGKAQADASRARAFEEIPAIDEVTHKNYER